MEVFLSLSRKRTQQLFLTRRMLIQTPAQASGQQCRHRHGRACIVSVCDPGPELRDQQQPAASRTVDKVSARHFVMMDVSHVLLGHEEIGKESVTLSGREGTSSDSACVEKMCPSEGRSHRPFASLVKLSILCITLLANGKWLPNRMRANVMQHQTAIMFQCLAIIWTPDVDCYDAGHGVGDV